MAISRRLRYEVFRRDDFACRYCGAKAPNAEITVDHVTPIALGGTDEPMNLVTACQACNAGKSSSSPDAPIVDGVTEDALRWARAMARAAQMQDQQREAVQRVVADFDAAWCSWTDGNDEPLPRPNGWEQSIDQWVKVGVSRQDLGYALEAAMAARVTNTRTWRYFCGVVWRLLDERQQTARNLIDTDQV